MISAPARSRLRQIPRALARAIHHDNRLVVSVNPWKMRVHMSANQTLTAGVTATMALDTVDFDSANGFSTSANSYTVPVSGWYAIFCKASFTLGANLLNASVSASLLANGVGWQGGTTFTLAGAFTALADGQLLSGSYDAQVNDQRHFNAGDVITVQVLQNNNAGSSQTLQGGASVDSSYLSMHLISA